MNNNENLNNLNNNSMGDGNVNNSVVGSNPLSDNNVAANTVSQTNLNSTEVNPVPTVNPATSDLINGNINSLDSVQNNIGTTEPTVNNNVLTSNGSTTMSQAPVQPSIAPQSEVAPQNLGSQSVNPNENLAMSQASVQPEVAMPQNLNNQPINSSVNNIPNQNLDYQQPVVNNSNKGNNKNLIIILIVSVTIALIAIIVAVIIINKNKSTTENEYENPGTVSQTTDTMEFNGYVINKKAGYIYQLDDEVNALVIANDKSAFQVSILPYSFNSIELQKGDCRNHLSSAGYNPTNMKVSEYSGKKVLSFDLDYEDIKMLYFIYPISLDNTSVEIYALNRTSNTIDYNLITESFELTKDIKKSNSTFVEEKTDGDLKVSETSSKLFEK